MAYVLRDEKASRARAGRPGPGRAAGPGIRARRHRTVRFALTEDEYAEVSAAARQAGLARGAYAAEATLAIARGDVTTPDAPLRDAFMPWTAPRCWSAGSAST